MHSAWDLKIFVFTCDHKVAILNVSSPNTYFRTAIGVKCKDGVVLALEKLLTSKMLVPGSNRRIFTVDRHLGVVSISSKTIQSCVNGVIQFF